MLRTRLLIAFAALAIVTAVSGGVSLLLVNGIGRAVSVFSDVTSPLLVESAGLIDSARRMRALSTRAMNEDADSDTLRGQLEDLDTQSRAQLAELARLAQVANIHVGIESAQQTEAVYAKTLADMIAASRAARVSAAATTSRAANFENGLHDSKAAIRVVVDRAEGLINENEEKAKVDLQTGAATVPGLGALMSSFLTDIYPRVQNSRKLLGALDELSDLVKLAMAQNDEAALSGIQASAQRTFKSMGTIMRRLQGRLRDSQGEVEFAGIEQSLAGLRKSLDDLFSSQHETLVAKAEIENGRQTLDRIDRQYFEVLNNAQHAVAGLNADARTDAANGVINARSVVIASSVAALIAALVLALMFSQRITSPLTRLAEHAVAIRRTGELTPVPEEGIAGQYDEIEKLSRAFNEMVGELADTRARLIEWSEGEIRTQFERLNAAIDNMPLGLCMFDKDQKLIICNRNYGELYQIPEQDRVPGTPLRTIFEHRLEAGTYGNASSEVIEQRLAMIASGKPWYGINELSDGRVIAISHRPMANGGHVSIHEDITERRKAELRIAHMAHHDALTDLPNRVRFREDIVGALGRVKRGETLAVLCIDLDNFKDVNDTLGHPIGDELLRQVAKRLTPCIRPQDAIARLGGDEFAILQTGADQPVSATAIATRLIKEMSTPFEVGGHQVVIGASVGISIAPNDGDDPDDLLKKADLALYRAKEDGRGTYRFFEPEMDARMQSRRALELDLRQALPLGQFEVYYQPLITVNTGEIAGFEALLRWNHPTRGQVPPDQFIPLTEEIGLINGIGAWVLKQACAEAVKWPDHIKIAVNLSPVQFKNKALVLDVVAALGQSGLKPQRLELEITEAVLLQDTEATIATLNELRALGVRIAMDDFGTGYSSLSYLQKFPFDKIKIDRSFIRDMADKPDAIAIVRAVTGLSSTLGMETTAEGVETPDQLDLLTKEGCTEVQGYLFSKARPAEEVAGLIADLSRAKAVA